MRSFRCPVACAGNLKRVTLELGGKSPVIIFPDADLGPATEVAARGIFMNTGQVCAAGSRLFVHEKVFDQVVEGVVARARALKLGAGTDSATDLGPVVSEEQRRRVTGYIRAGVDDGARVLTGGGKVPGPGYFVEPTVLAQTNRNMKVVREEIFGPVVTAMPFSDPEEILPRANDSEYGLAAAVWTRDISKAHRTAEQLRAGTVWINCYNIFDAALPFGGYKQSGWGREMGHDALNLYTQTKAICTKLS